MTSCSLISCPGLHAVLTWCLNKSIFVLLSIPVVLKAFSYSLLTNPNTINSSSTKITNDTRKNFTLPTVKKQERIMNQTDSFITSEAAVKDACTCKLQAHDLLYHGAG